MKKLILSSCLLLASCAFSQSGRDKPIDDYEIEQSIQVYSHEIILDVYLEAIMGSEIDDNLEICIATDCQFYQFSDLPHARTTHLKAPRKGPKGVLETAKELIGYIKSSSSTGVRGSIGSIKIHPDGTVELTDINFFAGSSMENIPVPGFEGGMQKHHK